MDPLHSSSFRMGLEPKKSFSREGVWILRVIHTSYPNPETDSEFTLENRPDPWNFGDSHDITILWVWILVICGYVCKKTFQWVPIFPPKGCWIDTRFTWTIWHPNWKVQVSLNWLFQRLEPPNRLLEKENHLNQTSILWLQHVIFSGCTWRIIPGRPKWLG